MPNYELFVECGAADIRHYSTHDTLHFCINNAIKITWIPSPTSHQFWLHEDKALYPKRTKGNPPEMWGMEIKAGQIKRRPDGSTFLESDYGIEMDASPHNQSQYRSASRKLSN
jgi:hypothetical protein